MSAEKPVTYEAWRITYQSSEAAARAAFSACVTLRAALAIAERQRDEARERLEKLEADNKRLRRGLENALIHTAHLPHASRDLLEGLLASVARICKEALGIDTARTSAPAPQQGGE